MNERKRVRGRERVREREMVLYSWRLSQKSDVAQSFWKRRTKQSKAKQNKIDLLGLLTLRCLTVSCVRSLTLVRTYLFDSVSLFHFFVEQKKVEKKFQK